MAANPQPDLSRSAFAVPRLPAGKSAGPIGKSTPPAPKSPGQRGLGAGGVQLDVRLVDSRFEAMGTRCHVVLVDSDPGLLAVAEAEVRRLERIWTRFDARSELSRLNARSGHVGVVSGELALLVQRSCFGYSLTDGFFDPFLGAEVVAAGYDRDFDQLSPVPTGAAAPLGDVAGTRSQLGSREQTVPRSVGKPAQLDMRRRLVRLRRGSLIDSGGLGKGLGADMVSDLLMRRGATGVLVNLGGDLRVRGTTPPGGWRIGLDDPFDAQAPPHSTVTLHAGGLATSTPLRRRWQRSDGSVANHIIDPRTGRSLDTRTASVSAIAPSGWLAEVWAKAVLIASPERGLRLLRRSPECTCIAVDADRRIQQLGAYSRVNLGGE